jgi:hypothetical protein
MLLLMLLGVAFFQASDVIGGMGTAAVAPTLPEAPRFSRRGFGGRMAYGTPQPGRKVSPLDVKSFSDAPLYDLKTLRTVFVDFRQAGWEAELESNNRRDINVSPTVTIDGQIEAAGGPGSGPATSPMSVRLLNAGSTGTRSRRSSSSIRH